MGGGVPQRVDSGVGAAVVPVRGASTRGHLARSALCFTGPELGFVPTEQRKKPCSTPNDPLVPLGFP